jgi:DNA-binding response OmpR family regulator
LDDEVALARVVASYLEREGFDVELAHDGPGAVTVARDWRPDLVVLDVMLPGLDGIEVCRQIRGFTDTYIIMLAAMAERPHAAFSRRQLIDAVWGGEWYGDEHVVDVHIGHLRRKLGDDAAAPAYIRTVRGIGYGMGTG